MANPLYPLGLRARVNRRPYWALRYLGGRVVEEPDCDWLDAPRQGRQSLRLYCPNGDSVTFEAEGDGTGKFLQFKQAVITAAIGHFSGPSGTLCQVVGMVVGTDGTALCAAWEYDPGRLVRFEDNVYAMKYGNIGRLSADHLGLDTR